MLLEEENNKTQIFIIVQQQKVYLRTKLTFESLKIFVSRYLFECLIFFLSTKVGRISVCL